MSEVVQELIAGWADLWAPPEPLTLSRWAEKHFVLSPEYSAKSGDLHLFGWQREILDSFTDPACSEIALMCGTQLIKTLFMQVAVAYAIAKAPAPILLAQYKEDDVEMFSKERLDPMIRDMACLRERIPPAKSRDGTNTTLFKKFPGGSLSLVGAGAPGNAARRSICYAFLDEVDKYKVTKEGDFVGLVRERLATYRSRKKLVLACSPTVKGHSRIGRAYEDSDQRKPWVPCGSCGEYQILRWHQVIWNNALPREQRPATARYECEHCGALWNDSARWAACEQAQWRASKPFAGKRGYWISHLYSPWKKLSEIVADFLVAKDDKQAFQVFVNTTLAQLWEDEGERPQWEVVKGLTEDYEFGDEVIVPERASFVTAAVDVQRDWLAVELKAWGRHRESWSLGIWDIRLKDSAGQPLQTSAPDYWAAVDEFLNREWIHESGARLSILLMAIDTGERPKPVYDYARRHRQLAYGSAGLRLVGPRTVMPVKGSSTQEQHWRMVVSVSTDDAARKRSGVKIVTIGGGFGKQEFYDCLQLRPNAEGAYPNGYCHLPRYEDWILQGFCSEKRVVHASGSVTWEKEYPRNEPLDLHVYNRACASVVGIDQFAEKHWRRIEESQGIRKKKEPEPLPANDPVIHSPQQQRPMIQQQPAAIVRRPVTKRRRIIVGPTW